MLGRVQFNYICCQLAKLKQKTPVSIWSHSKIWAEEAGFLNPNQSEWSFGNGGTGPKGIPVGNGYEIVGMFFHADNYASATATTIDCMDYQDVNNPVALCDISLINSTDGTGQASNGTKIVTFDPPLPVPTNAVLGFRTRLVSGSVSDCVVGLTLRHDEQVLSI